MSDPERWAKMKPAAIIALVIVMLTGCASQPADPFAPSPSPVDKMKIQVFEMNTEYPPRDPKEIEALLNDRSKFGRNGNPREEAGIIQYIAEKGVSFEKTDGSFLWIPYALTRPSGWPSRERSYIIVRQTPRNLKKIQKIFSTWEAEHLASLQPQK